MGSTVNSSSRINWIDTAKAISIILVVLGHALSDGLLQSYVYAFHVPAFFFISGFFAKSSGGFLPFLKKRFCQIMIPYYIFGMLAILAYQIMGRFVADEVLMPIECLYGLAYSSVKTDCLKFNLHLWFLPAILLCS